MKLVITFDEETETPKSYQVVAYKKKDHKTFISSVQMLEDIAFPEVYENKFKTVREAFEDLEKVHKINKERKSNE